eukprot:5980360-Heterocapsa_arctica.AAC.1
MDRNTDVCGNKQNTPPEKKTSRNIIPQSTWGAIYVAGLRPVALPRIPTAKNVCQISSRVHDMLRKSIP